MTTKRRVLLIAEAANPEWTSVPLVGWSVTKALLEVFDGHLVTQVRNRAAIERAGLRHGREFTALDSEPIARPLWKATEVIRRATGIGWTFETAMQILPYYYFEHILWEQFGKDIQAGRWDVVHRLTPLTPSTPSLLATRCKEAGVPFVLGPLNGGVPWPKGFEEAQRREGEWLSPVRDVYKLLPGYRSTHRDASAVIVASRTTLDQLPSSSRERAVYLPENAVDPARFDCPVTGPVRTPLRVAFVGRLVPCKGVDLLLEATADLMRAGKLQIDIIGDGPEREPLAAQVQRLGVGQAVRMEGWVEHKLLARRLAESDVFGFPSVREFGGAVVLEAMALGLVPVVADYAGPAELVTSDTGYKVAMGSPEQVVRGLREIFERLVADPAPLRAMGERARDRVNKLYTWQAKAQQLGEVYSWVCGERNKPDFGMPLRE